MQAIVQINVSMPGRTKEHGIARGLAGGCMGGGIGGSQVGLDFDNTAGAQTPSRSTNQHLPE